MDSIISIIVLFTVINFLWKKFLSFFTFCGKIYVIIKACWPQYLHSTCRIISITSKIFPLQWQAKDEFLVMLCTNLSKISENIRRFIKKRNKNTSILSRKSRVIAMNGFLSLMNVFWKKKDEAFPRPSLVIAAMSGTLY